MTDRDLEARLRVHLHRRFDGAQPSTELAAAVQQVIATPPRRIRLPQLRGRSFRPGWAVVAVALGVAVLAVAGLRFGGLLGPGAATQTPTPTASPERQFMVLPPTAALPSKAESTLAGSILMDRLRALGFGNFSSGGGYGLEFRLPSDGPSDTAVRAVLAATGDIEIVPLPPEDYGDGKLEAVIGEPLPKDEPTLFGWDGIASAARAESVNGPTLVLTLKPAAREAFADYTVSHIGETTAILIDGRVALLPMITSEIPGGEIEITGGGGDDDAFEVTVAILVGGKLPESWAAPDVPIIISQESIIRTAVRDRAVTVESADLDVVPDTNGWRVVWDVTLEGQFPIGCPFVPSGGFDPSRCPDNTTEVETYDAVTGDLLSSHSPA